MRSGRPRWEQEEERQAHDMEPSSCVIVCGYESGVKLQHCIVRLLRPSAAKVDLRHRQS